MCRQKRASNLMHARAPLAFSLSSWDFLRDEWCHPQHFPTSTKQGNPPQTCPEACSTGDSNSSKLFLYKPHSVQVLAPSPYKFLSLFCEMELSSNVRLTFSGVQRKCVQITYAATEPQTLCYMVFVASLTQLSGFS